jgi:hypothetical protein
MVKKLDDMLQLRRIDFGRPPFRRGVKTGPRPVRVEKERTADYSDRIDVENVLVRREKPGMFVETIEVAVDVGEAEDRGDRPGDEVAGGHRVDGESLELPLD